MKAKKNHRQSRLGLCKSFAGVIIILSLMGGLLWTPAIHNASAKSVREAPTIAVVEDGQAWTDSEETYLAQFRSEWLNTEFKKAQAPVILDGRQLFVVARVGEYRADFRAKLIEEQLKVAAESSEEIEVKVGESNNMPAIFLNNQQLLTVTNADAPDRLTPEAQAYIWADEIRKALQKARQERDGKFIQRSLIYTAAIVVLALIVNWGMGKLWYRYVEPLLQRLTTPSDSEEDESTGVLHLLLSLALAIARTLVWMGAALYISNLFPFTRQWSYRIVDALKAALTSPILTLGERSYSVINLLILAVMLFGLVALSAKVTHLLKCRVLRMTGINRAAQEAVAIMTRYGLIFIGSLVLLQVWGLDISSLTIVVSALSVAIGFGFQDIAKNFGSGLVLLFERPIQVGDFVEVGEYTGTVERIGSRSTMIRTLDQISIIVPNSRFLESEVINWTHGNPVSRLHVPVGVSYGSNASEVESVLLDAAKGHPDVLLVPPPRVMFKGFGESSLNFALLVWTAEPSKQFFLKSDLYFRIFSLLGDRGIEIPFPQRDLHVRSGSLPIELSPQLEQVLLQLLQRLGNKSTGGNGSL